MNIIPLISDEPPAPRPRGTATAVPLRIEPSTTHPSSIRSPRAGPTLRVPSSAAAATRCPLLEPVRGRRHVRDSRQPALNRPTPAPHHDVIVTVGWPSTSCPLAYLSLAAAALHDESLSVGLRIRRRPQSVPRVSARPNVARHDWGRTATRVPDWGSDRFAARRMAGNLTSRSQPSAKGCDDTGDDRPRWTHRPDAGMRASPRGSVGTAGRSGRIAGGAASGRQASIPGR